MEKLIVNNAYTATQSEVAIPDIGFFAPKSVINFKLLEKPEFLTSPDENGNNESINLINTHFKNDKWIFILNLDTNKTHWIHTDYHVIN